MADADVDDQAISSYAQWLLNSLSEHREREEVLSKEITAVREAAAVGATALVELRAAVQDQLDSVARQLARLAQDLEATKLELAEVVIEKEEDEGELKREVESLRKMLESHKGLQHTQENQLGALKKELLEASEREADLKKHLEAKVGAAEERVLQKTENFQSQFTQRLEECVVESHMVELLTKFDISVGKQLEQLREAQVAIQNQHRSVHSKEEDTRRLVEECDRKLLALADQMTTVEESHRHDVEQLHAEIQELTQTQEKEKEVLMTPNQGSIKIPSDTESRHASAGRGVTVKNDPQTPASISIPVGLPQSGGSCGLPTTLGGPTHHQSSHSHGGLATPNTTVGIGTPVAAQSSVPPITLAMGTPQNIVAPAYTTATTDSWRFSPAQPVWAVSAGAGVRRLSVLSTPTTHG